MIVLDTHAWIWWVSSPDLLSEEAKRIIDGAVGVKNIFGLSATAWPSNQLRCLALFTMIRPIA